MLQYHLGNPVRTRDNSGPILSGRVPEEGWRTYQLSEPQDCPRSKQDWQKWGSMLLMRVACILFWNATIVVSAINQSYLHKTKIMALKTELVYLQQYQFLHFSQNLLFITDWFISSIDPPKPIKLMRLMTFNANKPKTKYKMPIRTSYGKIPRHHPHIYIHGIPNLKKNLPSAF